MRKVILVFPDTATLSRFVLDYSLPNTEVNTTELSLTSYLSEELIVTACTSFGAEMKQLMVAL